MVDFELSFANLVPLSVIHSKFMDLFREEQMRRSVHLLSLPLDLRLHILSFCESSVLQIYRRREHWKDVLAKDGISWMFANVVQKERMHRRLLCECKKMAKLFFSPGRLHTMLNFDKPLILLAEDLSPKKLKSDEGTSEGKFILVILEDDREFRLSPASDELIMQSDSLRLSAHEGILARIRRLSKRSYEKLETINLNLPGHEARPIWYVQPSLLNETIELGLKD
tara:strand:+ start:810 stop:1484 length:675 start_codon:yes stop_codon:yes gene_type:complete